MLLIFMFVIVVIYHDINFSLPINFHFRFSGTCNHVAAVLFKVEFAWKSGLTNPACTAKECGWAAFGAKHRVEPERIKNMNWHKPHFSKRGIEIISKFLNRFALIKIDIRIICKKYKYIKQTEPYIAPPPKKKEHNHKLQQ